MSFSDKSYDFLERLVDVSAENSRHRRMNSRFLMIFLFLLSISSGYAIYTTTDSFQQLLTEVVKSIGEVNQILDFSNFRLEETAFWGTQWLSTSVNSVISVGLFALRCGFSIVSTAIMGLIAIIGTSSLLGASTITMGGLVSTMFFVRIYEDDITISITSLSIRQPAEPVMEAVSKMVPLLMGAGRAVDCSVITAIPSSAMRLAEEANRRRFPHKQLKIEDCVRWEEKNISNLLITGKNDTD